ncbi:3'-5' exonuclease [Phormidesmis sp. 146-33]
MSSNLLIIDTETTGLCPTQDRVIELGAILYSIEHKTVLHQLSTLLCAPAENPAEKTNRICPNVLPTVSESLQQKNIEIFLDMADTALFAVAHNADFDKQWFDGKHLPVLQSGDEPMKWLCTMDDFVFPLQTRPRESLINLALAHGIGVSCAHRALTDCQLIAALFDRMDSLVPMISHALRPKEVFRALVSFDNKQMAKDAGFRWNPEDKTWARKMAVEDTEKLPFKVLQISQ